ncbi:MAG TPA: hypothetical protein VE775_11070, partial [Pyrinomonadaceae bacterium]|nr:hypothetical protein [Pyrinomonadaceae bacterium]
GLLELPCQPAHTAKCPVSRPLPRPLSHLWDDRLAETNNAQTVQRHRRPRPLRRFQRLPLVTTDAPLAT